MEPAVGAFLGDEWDALCQMFTSEDEDLVLQFHGNDLLSNEINPTLCLPNQSIFFPINEGNQHNMGNLDGSLQGFNVLEYLNFHNVSQENSNDNGDCDSQSSNPNLEFYQIHCSSKLIEEPNHLTMDETNAYMFASFLDVGMEDMLSSPRQEVGWDKFGNEEDPQPSIGHSGNKHLLKRKVNSPEAQVESDYKSTDGSAENPSKRPRVSRSAQKSNTKVQSKPKRSMIKAKQISNVDEEEGNGVVSSDGSSEDDVSASQESNGGAASDNKDPALNLNGKKRASRGSASEPQSLYARRRRERINDRLRILQNLIPNGTKVDISTMLEEAVQYVKFLQLQIKLLSSDDLWMYAPFVYNGIDVGMYSKIFPAIQGVSQEAAVEIVS